MSVPMAHDFDTPAPELPPELRRWNWGAFFLNWIWGLGNGTYIALLMFVPFVNIVMPFVLGAKGDQWAWKNGRWRSAEHFRRVQRLWAIWSFVAFGVSILFFVGLFALVSALMSNSEPYRLGVAKLQSDPRAAELLGNPIKAGLPTGSIEDRGQSGDASYDFSVSGAKTIGRVSLKAVEAFDRWTITSLKLKLDGQDEVVEIVAPADGVLLLNYRLTIPGVDAAKPTFSTEDKKISLMIDYSRPVEGTHVVADWRKDGSGPGTADEDVIKSDFTLDANASQKSILTFDITTRNGLPPGDYHVDVSVNGKLMRSLPFRIVGK